MKATSKRKPAAKPATASKSAFSPKKDWEPREGTVRAIVLAHLPTKKGGTVTVEALAKAAKIDTKAVRTALTHIHVYRPALKFSVAEGVVTML